MVEYHAEERINKKDTAPVFTFVFVYLGYKFFVSHVWNI